MKSRMPLVIALPVLIIFFASLVSPVQAVRYSRPAAKPDLPLSDLLVYASNDINTFWYTTFNSSRRGYAPPKMIPYTQPIRTPCGIAGTNNAFYCPASNCIYYDYNFLNRSYSNVGDYAAVGIIAHEWGHLVQAHLGISRGNSFSIQMELQADCFAGAYTQYAARTGKLDPGDLDEAGEDLFRSGDARGMPWFAPQAHGTSIQRISAFLDGYRGGANACFSR